MINISFDNPLLLLLLIPMLALILVPYFIAIRKENKSRAGVIALALHIVIIILVVLAAAGMSNVTVITETELYVVADVSDSMWTPCSIPHSLTRLLLFGASPLPTRYSISPA